MTALADLLTPRAQGRDRFLFPPCAGAEGRLFGGQALGQALAGALATIAPDRIAHSLHAHFLRTGDATVPVDVAVERVREGRSFATRAVTLSQDGRELLRATISCQLPEDGLSHQPAVMPRVPGPEGLPSELELRQRAAPEAEIGEGRKLTIEGLPVDIRTVFPRDFANPRPMAPEQHFWMRVAASAPDGLAARQALLAYLSDMMLLSTGLLPHGVYWSSTPIDGISLDHSMWFHADPVFDDWLLWSMETPWGGGGRALAQGRFFRRDGTLVATAVQEGLIRVREA